MAYLRDRRAFGNIGTRKFRGARFGDPLSPRGPQYTLEGRVLDYSTDVGPFTIVDQSGESNTATLYSGRGLTMDAVNDTVTYATGYSLGSRTATVWMRVDTLGTRVLGSTVGGAFLFTPTATGVWEELTYTRLNIEGDLLWLAGSDCDIGDLRVGTEHWTHNDLSNPTANTSNGKTIVDSGPNDYHGTCTGCSGFTGEGIDPDVAGIVGLDDARWFNGVDSKVAFGDTQDEDGSTAFFIEATILPASALLSSIVDKQAAATSYQGYAFRADGGELQFTIGSTGANRLTVVTAGANLNDGAVHVCRVTYDGSKSASGVSFLVDGVSQSVSIAVDAFTGNSAATGINLAIGGRDIDGAVPFKGTIYAVNINDQLAVTGLGNTPWEDTIGTNDGTESGTFVSVGQKRATIPQTADKNWNKGLFFNGSNEYLSASPAAFDPSADNQVVKFSFIQAGGSSSASILFGYRDQSTELIQITQQDSTTLILQIRGSDNILKTSSITVSAFSHVTGTLTYNGALKTASLVTNQGTATVTGFGTISTSAYLTIAAVNSGTFGIFFNGLVARMDINGVNALQATRTGTPDQQLISASDANDKIDALGTAISEPRLNTQQLNLFGEGEYSSTPDSASLDVTTAATLEVWGNFYFDSSVADEYILDKVAYSLWKNNVANVALVYVGLAGAAYYITVPNSLCQLVVTYAGIGPTLKAYVDGSEAAVTLAGGTLGSALSVSTDPVVVGSSVALDAPFSTKIGSAKIYNVALTAAEVLTNFNSQRLLYGAWGKYLATVNSFYESTQTIDQSSYIETNVGARWEIVTDASSINVESFTSLIQARNAIAKIGYRINGGAWASFGPSTQDTSSIETIALPAGSNAVEFINGIQTTEGTSNVDGTWVQSVSPSPDTTSFTSVVATNLANQLVIYGDSITAGGNATNLPYEGYPIVLRDAISNPVTVEAWGYRTLYEDCNTAGLIDTFVAKLAAVSPTSIWLAIGTNDYALNKQSAANFETMYAALLADLVVALPSTKIYCASPVHRTSEVANTFGDTTGDYRTAISNAVTTTADADVTYVDTSAWLVDGDLDDGVHPTTAGHAIMASQIQTALGL